MIYLLCSTIRPEVFKVTHKVWMDKACVKENIKTKLVVDGLYDQKLLEGYDSIVYKWETNGITKPLTYLTKSLSNMELNDDDIIVVMSDDFFPPKHWDIFLESQFRNFDGMLSVYDGLQDNDTCGIITIPILTYSFLKKLNHIVYHPAYNHMYSDQELYDICKELNSLKIVNKTLGYTFEHRHWTTGKRKKDGADETINSNQYERDRRIYLKRKKLSLNDKLKIEDKQTPLLSILICSLKKRKKELNRLLSILKPQLNEDVEVITMVDDGKCEIGKKRNTLLKKASGKYVCFIDDDDLITEDYVNKILSGCLYNPDSIGIEGIITTNGKDPKIFKHSIRYEKWGTIDDVYVRSPNHLNPIRRSIALKIMFEEISHGEDWKFSHEIFKHLKKEYYIKGPIYKYLYTEIK